MMVKGGTIDLLGPRLGLHRCGDYPQSSVKNKVTQLSFFLSELFLKSNISFVSGLEAGHPGWREDVQVVGPCLLLVQVWYGMVGPCLILAQERHRDRLGQGRLLLHR